ncbi:YkvA family protein [Mitsuokella sp. WILCCON 0060]|uniref:YkvA family protein n=1 Tax=unclassified Mitsuokella TaxID=2637239 RepID=UPI003F0593A5
MGRIFGVLRLFRHDILVMLLSLKSRQTPRKVKGMMLFAILYLLSPIDLIPDAIPVAGLLDDAVIVPTVIAALMHFLPPQVRYDCEGQADYILRHGKLAAAFLSLFVLLWAGVLIWGIYKLLS